ncbi:hypothetical protein GSI_08907 [Ganoderma sinense ZZ0214-1]|uniref:Uncharacterized protein n=1 Tax=Ganoderma sinense ZZ0214-1 TaxID=1077348 RepID=A0A2G8S531_9APHY|nr:hypothetical protein GSI_08907 [Ganoderma sinense ZZ0214-1]
MSSSDASDAQVIFIPKSTPNITDGRVTPAVANTFEHGCVVHFKDKDVPPGRQVAKATANITNALISDWYIARHEEFDAMTFEEFMAEFRDQWLPHGWAMKLRAQILQASQSRQEPFDLFCIRVMKLNTQLRGSNLRFDDDGLRATISANLYPDLAVQANEYAITSIGSFKDWQDAVNELDIARRRIDAQVLSLIATNSKATTKQKASNPFVGVKDAPKPKLPKLTDLEYTYLRTVKGCFKCRKDVDAAHTSANCPNGYPDAATYTTCIPKGWKPSDKENKKPSAHSVNALNAAGGLEDTNVVAAIEALATSTGVLGSGSDSETYVPPLIAPHTILHARIIAPETYSDVLPMLADSAAPTVLIRRSLAVSLKLPLRKLPSPFQFSTAWGSGQKESSEWVKLAVTLKDYSWSSQVVRAIVVDSLCAPVILGKPFLQSNCLVEDFAACTLTDKRCGRDLLAPPSPPPPLRFLLWTVASSEVLLPKNALPSRMQAVSATAISFANSSPQPVGAASQRTTQRRTRLLSSVRLFVLKDANMVIARRQYDCPKKWRDAWKTLLEQHLAAVPKTDPAALPRWVNDYRVLNANTVPDMYPLPRISDILADCAKGSIWGKIDMTNAYFQTRVHPDDIKYTAVTTPFGLYEWTVMPQGCRNAPSTHQRRMYNALRPFLGKFCHVYLDDIVIWSQSLDEHRRNVETVLQALREASLFCSDKKTDLFLTELHFLGHIVSSAGIQADPSKVEKILNWPVPRNARAVRAFLGLVRYVASFLPNLADHTMLLTPLTTKEAEASFPEWTSAHQRAFDAIKQLVVSRECLTVIDHDDLERNKIFVSCDASDLRTGALLSFGPSLEQARPVAFDSAQLKGAELNYPVHEKELLAIVRALKKWRVDLLGVPFEIYTDHRTLENFHRQKDLSRRQACWQEFLSQYDFTIRYIKGEDNVAADALSRIDVAALPVEPSSVTIASTLLNATTVLAACAVDIVTDPALRNSVRFSLHTDPAWLGAIRAGYTKDKFCLRLRSLAGTLGVREQDGLLYIGDRLVIPRVPHLREGIFRCAHDALGHFGFEKSYANLRDAYYWPHMRKELESLYIPSCEECQRNKSLTRKPTGPLHPLPVPDARASSVAIDFIGPLPEDEGFNCLATITDRLGSDYRLVPCRTDTTAEQFAVLFFDHWFCENGLPLEIVSDRDKLFTSKLWDALHKLTGIKLKLSTAFHPQTDGSSERTNKTVTQALRYHVNRAQRGWVRALPRVRFAIMNTVNASTGFSPFQLHLGRSPRLIPPVVNQPVPSSASDAEVSELARSIIDALQTDIMEAQDNLLASKLAQASAANAHRAPERVYAEGDRVLLSTFHRRREYVRKRDGRTAKFMVRFDGPYEVLRAHPETSVYTLKLPDSMRIFPTFHASLLRPFVENDATRFPSRTRSHPGPIVTADGQEEWLVESILDRRRRGRGFQYLVRWAGYGPEADLWLPGKEVEDLEALDRFEAENPNP